MSKFPLAKWLYFVNLMDLKVGKLLVGVSFTASAATEKLFGVKLLPLPLESLPNVVAVVPELSNPCLI